jgi:hypothetical protein
VKHRRPHAEPEADDAQHLPAGGHQAALALQGLDHGLNLGHGTGHAGFEMIQGHALSQGEAQLLHRHRVEAHAVRLAAHLDDERVVGVLHTSAQPRQLRELGLESSDELRPRVPEDDDAELLHEGVAPRSSSNTRGLLLRTE